MIEHIQYINGMTKKRKVKQGENKVEAVMQAHTMVFRNSDHLKTRLDKHHVISPL